MDLRKVEYVRIANFVHRNQDDEEESAEKQNDESAKKQKVEVAEKQKEEVAFEVNSSNLGFLRRSQE